MLNKIIVIAALQRTKAWRHLPDGSVARLPCPINYVILKWMGPINLVQEQLRHYYQKEELCEFYRMDDDLYAKNYYPQRRD
jgi:hypothetical protein